MLYSACMPAFLRKFHSHPMPRYVSEHDGAAAHVDWEALDLAFPDVHATTCMLGIAHVVLCMSRELALCIGCSPHMEALVMKKLSRAICTVSRIALAVRIENFPSATAQLHDGACEDRLLLCNDMRVLSVALARAAADISRQMVLSACPQAQPVISELCLLSRSASMRASDSLAAIKNRMCSAVACCVDRCVHMRIASAVESCLRRVETAQEQVAQW